MHELSIASALMELIRVIAAEHRLAVVDEVEIETGRLRQVIPEFMQTAFREVARGTLAEGAILKVREVAANARCLLCGRRFEPEIDDFVCSVCGRAEVEILGGDSIILRSLSGPQLEPVLERGSHP